MVSEQDLRRIAAFVDRGGERTGTASAAPTERRHVTGVADG
ncbi:hypothetical protein [Haloglomus halophilum]|jgi:hypothetical protein|nr:hypothetical protein [Haloglomus halophilum]